jgi:hypothetical protein
MTTPLDRPSARVIVIDGTDSVLLFLIKDPVAPSPRSGSLPAEGSIRAKHSAKPQRASSLKRPAWSSIPQSWAILSLRAGVSGLSRSVSVLGGDLLRVAHGSV